MVSNLLMNPQYIGGLKLSVRKAVIPAAGLGTRFLPATKGIPKEMLPIIDKPTLQYIVEEAVDSGITEILIIIGRNKQAIEDHFDRNPELEDHLLTKGQQELLNQVKGIANLANIHFVRQKEAKGLGHAILCAESFVGNEPFAVLLGDDVVASTKPCLGQLIKVHQSVEASVLGVQRVAKEDVSKYGIVQGEMVADNLYQVQALVEKPSILQAPSDVAVLGRYIITPKIFSILADTPPGKGGEIQLTDALDTLLTKENMFAHIFEGKRYDVGNKLGFLQATVDFALAREELKDEFAAYLLSVVERVLVK